MLTIGNIRDFNGKELNNWKIINAEEDNIESEQRYKIVFARIDNIGVMQDDRAGVLINRNVNALGKYHITIVYDEWTTIIYQTELSKESISKKEAFFGLLLYRINDEYYKRKK